ncbi:beta-propeller domain-containing protein [Cohnella sp. GCM10027633]|uniref:beta-propeller domain-containing protein n=1 Tax=unclassified Cohnella TaxID=2636738 RepID=UPI003637FD77
MGNKIFLTALLASVMLATTSVAAPAKPPSTAAPASGSIMVNGAALKLNKSAYVVKNMTMVPLRQIAEALGAAVDWGTDAQGRTFAKLTRGARSATITAGVASIVADGRAVKLGVAPELRSGTIMVPLRAISEALGTIVAWDGVGKVIRIDDPKQLPVIGTQKKLDELLKQMQQQTGVMYTLEGGTVVSKDSSDGASAPQAAPAAESAAESSAGSGGADHSETNVQVQGVDEADWAKTDGKFVYQISGSRIFISDISEPSSPKLAATLEYKAEDNFSPLEMYVDEGRLVVIGQRNSWVPTMIVDPPPIEATTPSSGAGASGSSSASGAASSPEAPAPDEKMSIMPVVPVVPAISTVQTKVYAIDDNGQPTLTRTTELEGNYVSSRKIDGALYVISNKYNYYNYYPMMEKRAESDGNAAASDSPANAFEPAFSDSATSKELKRLSLSDVRYFPNAIENSTMLIGALDLDRPEQAFQVSAYLGSGQTIYASSKHLYVAIARTVPDGADKYKNETHVYKFRLDQGNVVYVGEGSVPGNVLNQFSMDEHNGYFRIATTNGNMWDSGANRSTNDLYVLDEQLKTIGTLANLAPGERIYSVRFMGNRAYMVTFRNVDPLFVIDLLSPTKPAVLGQLKIPGYSDYLHPYDDNHLIGFGKETVELPSKGMGQDATMAFYQGIKIAMFDVTDVANPKELFKEVIGDRGTGSELLYNHKALLFDKSKGLMAFPVELMEVKNKEPIEQGGFPAYGQFVYQGAYVYGVDLDDGFTLRGRITHLSQDDLAKSGQYGFDYGKSVRRILYANDTLYTLSERMLKANALGSLSDQGSISYPAPPEGQYYPYGGPAINVMPMPAVSGPAVAE